MADIHEVLVHCSAAVFSGALSSCLLFRHEAMVLTTHNFFYVFKDLVRLPSRLSSSRRSTAVQWIGQETWYGTTLSGYSRGLETEHRRWSPKPRCRQHFFSLCFPQDHSHGTGNSTYIQWPKCLPFGCLLHLWKTFSLLIAHSRKAGSSGTPPILRWMLNLFPIMLSILLTFPCARWYSLHI